MIGVCIRYFHKNYGGVLQAFATVEYLKKENIDFRIIRFYRDTTLVEKVRDFPRLLNKVWLNSRLEGMQRETSLKKNPEYCQHDKERMAAFETFMHDKFDPWVDIYHGSKDLCERAVKYDVVITGSDQLWSPAALPTNFFNLMFVPDGKLKISLASSFGVKEIPWYQKRRTAQYLNRIEYISMRENRGSEIVKELTGRDVPTILDPVFFLSKDEWLERIPNKREIDEPYIFAYFLGTTQEYRNAVQKLAKDEGMKVVALRHMDQYVKEDEGFGDFAPYDVGPERFLNFLRNAEYVCTDSFHGTAFSILNEKQFVVFNRYAENSSFSKNSRIDTLCVNFDLENHRYKNGMNLYDIVKNDIDYKAVREKYKELKQVTDEYLGTILHEIKKRT